MSLPEVFSEFWTWRMREFPEYATFCGNHQYDDQLNDHTPEAMKRRATEAQSFVERLRDLEASAKDDSERLSVELLRHDLQAFIDGVDSEGYLYTMAYIEGLHIDFEQLTSWMVFNDVKDYERYVGRLKALPGRLAQDTDAMKKAIAAGKTLHKISMEAVPGMIDSLDVPREKSVFFQPFANIPSGINADDIAPLKEEAWAVIAEKIIPAFMEIKKFIQEVYLGACRPAEGASTLPGGAAYYQQCLDWHLSLPMTPQEVHDLGLREVARIRRQMEEVRERVGFEGDLKAFIAQLRTNPKFYFSDREEALQGYNDMCNKQIRPALGKIFHKIPESQLIIVASPESRPDAPVGYYLAGTLDGSRPGKYYVNLTNLNMIPKYEMMTLSLHEGEPGHHFQGMYAIEQKDLPVFQRHMEDMYYLTPPAHFPFHTAYCEGWGLYCEWLGNELGLYEDPYSLFGHLSFEMHRACRLVADTGLHAFGWSFDRVVELFMENTALSEPFVLSEAKRYVCWPGQACAYKVGQLKIRELRDKAATALGEKFDVRDFHHEVLKTGAVPLTLLEKTVDQYIAAARQ